VKGVWLARSAPPPVVYAPRMRPVVTFALILAVMPAAAQVHTCTSAAGTREFTDRPCDSSRPAAPALTVADAFVLAALPESPPRLAWSPGAVLDGRSW
jgi:hypothetical protein